MRCRSITVSLPSSSLPPSSTISGVPISFRMWNLVFLLPFFLMLFVQPISSSSAPPYIRFSGEAFTTWDSSHVRILNNGSQLQLFLDEASGGGLSSKERFLFGKFEIQMKVAAGDTAGTVTSFYLSSTPETTAEVRDELDFEFLGNVSGQPYLLQTNIFTNGTGYKEQRISLWFDPTADFHTYAISWTNDTVIFSVDGIAIRTYPNQEQWGQLYVNRHSMGASVSIWNGDDWATLGGLIKINWTAAPFVANYQNFKADACSYNGNATLCMQSKFANSASPPSNLFDTEKTSLKDSLQWVEDNFMVYNYCDDRSRFPQAPPGCSAYGHL